jgi:hypothetical protein
MLTQLLYKFGLKKPKVPDRGELMKTLPLRNQLVKWEVDEKGEVSLTIPQDHKMWLRVLAKLFSLPGKRVIVLDDVGSYVWQLCDGQNSLRRISKQLSDKYNLTAKEAEMSLVEYLRALGKRGIIGFAVTKNMEKSL